MTFDEIRQRAEQAFPGCHVEPHTRIGPHGPQAEAVIYTGLHQLGELDVVDNDEWEPEQ